MASIYTTDLKIQLMATGENAGTWGQITNTNLTIIQQAIAGYDEVNIAGGAQTTALLMTQNQLSTARNIVLKLTGSISGNQIVTVPNDIEKTWIVSNGTTGTHTVTFKYASEGTGQTWSTTDKGIKILYGDGSDIKVVDLSTLSGTVGAAQITTSTITTTQLAANAVVANNIATGAVTSTKILTSTITTTQLAANSVVANNIVTSTITQSKLAANSVGANQLISTAVTPGSYTSASITVDADGRITAASSGSGGGGAYQPTLFVGGPTSGTHTAKPNANRLGVYIFAGGGAGAQSSGAGSGGGGGYGFYSVPISQPFSQPYSLGSQGNAPGGSGSPSTFTNVGTVNAGNGGGPNNAGSPGNAPGAYFVGPRSMVNGSNFGQGGNPGFGNGGESPSNNPGSPGQAGGLVVYENTGT